MIDHSAGRSHGAAPYGMVDRSSRSLAPGSLRLPSELPSLGVGLFLHQEGIDTTTLAGKAMFQMMGEFAEFERSMIVVRSRVRRRPRCWGAITSISRRQSASTLVK
jgi:hypothetical protein